MSTLKAGRGTRFSRVVRVHRRPVQACRHEACDPNHSEASCPVMLALKRMIVREWGLVSVKCGLSQRTFL